ncbi:MAG: radical SAM protein [Candidatus Eisenbacteria sp.]|nr:radical SAM protein [Candidatus Eisenbacteria bacterium]
MESNVQSIAFGPVPSRRLGQSLGINNIPPKICSYSCLYCQVGRTLKLQAARRAFYDPQEILREVRRKVDGARQSNQQIDYLTFVSDGEPTLDISLGQAIDLLRPLGIRIAVITNASLIWQADVRSDLARADWVSVKVDSVDERIWRKVNRPYGPLRLDAILNGITEFAESFRGEIATETMLINGFNDHTDAIQEVAGFLAQISPTRAYLSVPTRPPAEKRVQPPDAETLNRAYQILRKRLGNVEYLIGYEGNAFASTGDVEHDLLSITAVHPMRKDAVELLLSKSGADWSAVQQLVSGHYLEEVEYDGFKFYVRKMPPRG